MGKMKRCEFCGERVLANNGFFQSWPVPLALHHECLKPWRVRHPMPPATIVRHTQK